MSYPVFQWRGSLARLNSVGLQIHETVGSSNGFDVPIKERHVADIMAVDGSGGHPDMPPRRRHRGVRLLISVAKGKGATEVVRDGQAKPGSVLK